MTYNKYKNRKTTVDGIEFDSLKEARRYQELKLLARGGVIKDLELQPVFELIPKQKHDGKTIRKANYIADFKYTDIQRGITVVEDVKGFKTDVYKLKRRCFCINIRNMSLRRYDENFENTRFTENSNSS